jgi:hypothetical protein
VVLVLRPDIGFNNAMIVESSNTGLAKIWLVSTCSRYVVAPTEEFQLSVGLVETSVAKFIGADKIGANGALRLVVKLRVEYGLVPATFFAFTRQKYVVPATKPVIGWDVPVIVESLNTVTANVLLVETCTRYVFAPTDAFQLNVGFVDWLVARFSGAINTGANGAALVVKLHTVEYALVPAEFFVFTRQKYVVPIDKPETNCEVFVRVESL